MKKIHVIFAIIFLIAFSFIYRLYNIQLESDKYKIRAESTSIKAERIVPDRGYVFDRKGKLLIANRSNYSLNVIPKNISKKFDTIAFCKLIKIEKSYFIKKVNEAKKYSRFLSSPFLGNINKEKYGYIQEKIDNFSGFSLEKKSVRHYKIKSGANIVGYLGEVTLKNVADNPLLYKKGDFIGKTGVEASYEKFLKGKNGVRYYQKDIHQRVLGAYKNGIYDTLPETGKDLRLTIDYDLQKFTEDLMVNKRGGAVAIDVKTGEILALVTSPYVNPELLAIEQRTANYDSLDKHEDIPMLDRSILGAYPPGSPFKILTGLVGKQERVITDSTTYTCHHGFRYGRKKIGCHCGTSYRPIKLPLAMAKSCNNYFTSAYRDILAKYDSVDIGVQKWSEHLNSFGLGKFLGNDMPTGTRGRIPDSAYYNRRYGKDKWNFYSTMFNGMGQGEVSMSPIQMANFIAAVANKGWYYTPHIVKEIGGEPIKNPKFTTKNITTINPEHFDEVIEGMHKVYTMGTARSFRNRDIDMCGKTGTAQVSVGQDHSIFSAFGPKEDPQIAVAVFIENGHYGSTWAGPISTLMIEKYLTGEIAKKNIRFVNRMKNGNLRKEYDRVKEQRLEMRRKYLLRQAKEKERKALKAKKQNESKK